MAQPNLNRKDVAWNVYGNSIFSVGNANMTLTAKDGSGVMTLVDGAVLIPIGISDERPVASSGGMIRYNTTDDLVEYYNANVNQWLPISLPPPTLSTVTPNFIAENAPNAYSLFGSNFSTDGVSVVFTGLNGSGTTFTPDLETVLNDSNVTVLFDASNSLVDASNQLPMSATLTNDNSGFSSTLLNAVTAFNIGPTFVAPPNPAPAIINTFPVQDPSASFILQGIDLSTPVHYPLTFSIASGNPAGISDISSLGDLSAVFKVPTGNRTDPSAGTYNFFAQITDASNAKNEPVQYRVSLANPSIASIDPSFILDTSVVDIAVSGSNFVIDSDISFIDTGLPAALTKTGVTYNSSSSLTVNDVSAGVVGAYGSSVRNGSVLINIPAIVLSVIKQVDWTVTGYSAGSTYEIAYLDSLVGTGTSIGSPVIGGSTVLTFKGTAGSGGTGNISFNVSGLDASYLIVAGGGGGGGNDAPSVGGGGAGGGGGGGLLEGTSALSTSTLTLNVGAGGAAGGSGGSAGTLASQGGNSVYNVLTATGGGRGGQAGDGSSGTNPNSNAVPGGAGGAGGGGAGVSSGNGGGGSSGGSGSQGGNGGGPPGLTYFRLGAGGGGGGPSGQNGGNPFDNGSATFGGSGGDGTVSVISGASVTYAGGGGGGAGAGVVGLGEGGAGGAGGGGNGEDDGGGDGSNGTDFLGGGGGGADDQSANYYRGGSGVIILRFPSYVTP